MIDVEPEAMIDAFMSRRTSVRLWPVADGTASDGPYRRQCPITDPAARDLGTAGRYGRS